MSFQLTDISSHASQPPRGAIHVPSAGGMTKWWSSDVYTMKLTAEATNGALGAIRASVPPGSGPPPHVHAHSDEMFFLLSGELEFLDGDRLFTAQPGDLVFVPRTTLHRFSNTGPEPVSMLFLYTPGGPEGLFIEAGDEPQPGVEAPPWDAERIAPVLEMAASFDHVLPPAPA